MRLQQEPGIEVVAEAVDGEMAVELTNQFLPNVVLLDVGLPGIGGVEACRQIKQQHPDIPVFVLILALRSVAAGASWWDRTVTAEIRAVFENQPNSTTTITEALANPLTRREQEILALIAAGKSNQ